MTVQAGLTIDITMQEKAIAWPTDALLFNRIRERLLVRLAGIFTTARRNGRGVRSGG